jgi:hypothetical protein
MKYRKICIWREGKISLLPLSQRSVGRSFVLQYALQHPSFILTKRVVFTKAMRLMNFKNVAPEEICCFFQVNDAAVRIRLGSRGQFFYTQSTEQPGRGRGERREVLPH